MTLTRLFLPVATQDMSETAAGGHALMAATLEAAVAQLLAEGLSAGVSDGRMPGARGAASAPARQQSDDVEMHRIIDRDAVSCIIVIFVLGVGTVSMNITSATRVSSVRPPEFGTLVSCCSCHVLSGYVSQPP